MGISVVYIELLYRPLLNLMVFFYNSIPGMDIGLAVIAVTLAVKFALLPMSRKSIRSQRALQKLQPKLNEIKNKFKNDPEKQSKEMMKFYQENKVNPFSSCLPLLIQLPILWALFRVFRDGINNAEELRYLYSFISNPGSIDHMAFGIIDFSQRSIVLAILAGAFQFVQGWMMIKKNKKEKTKNDQSSKADNMATAMNTQMTYMMPLLTIFIAWTLPAGLSFYWIITTVFAIVQQWYIMKKEQESNGTNIEPSKKPT